MQLLRVYVDPEQPMPVRGVKRSGFSPPKSRWRQKYGMPLRFPGLAA